MSITEHPRGIFLPFTDQEQFLLSFSTNLLNALRSKDSVEKGNKTCFLVCTSLQGGAVHCKSWRWVYDFYRSWYEEFHVNLLFNYSVYRLMCIHMGKIWGNNTLIVKWFWPCGFSISLYWFPQRASYYHFILIITWLLSFDRSHRKVWSYKNHAI